MNIYHLKCEDEHASASAVYLAELQNLPHDLHVLKHIGFFRESEEMKTCVLSVYPVKHHHSPLTITCKSPL